MNWMFIGILLALIGMVYGFTTGWKFLEKIPGVSIPQVLNDTNTTGVPNQIQMPSLFQQIINYLSKNIVMPFWLLIIIVILIIVFRH